LNSVFPVPEVTTRNGEKLANQSELANALGISDRRVRQLEEQGVIIRCPDGNYDVDWCLRRYRLFIDRDINQVAMAVERAVERVDNALDQLRGEPGLEVRRRLVERLGPAVGELDGAMRLANALAPATHRELLESYTRMVVGRTAAEFLDLCNWRLAAE
jgi:hypothetical protein